MFANELSSRLPEDTREEMMHAFREILLNAMEHGAAFNPEQVVEFTAGLALAEPWCFTCATPGPASAANR